MNILERERLGTLYRSSLDKKESKSGRRITTEKRKRERRQEGREGKNME